VIEQGLPPLPGTDITLFVADRVNEATQRLAQTIQASPQYRRDEQPSPLQR
jgi:hypothetical protein